MAKRFQPPRLVVALAVLAAVGIACAQSEPIEPRPDDGTSGGAGTFGIAGFTGTGTAGSSASISGAGTTGASGSIGTTGSAGAKSNNTSGQAGTTDSSGSAGTGGSSGLAGSGGTGTGGSAGGAGTFGFAGRGGTTGSAGRGGTGGTGGTAGGRGGTTGSAGRGGTTGSPDGGANPDGAATVTFTDIYTTILVTYCSGSSCHSPGTQAGVSFASQSSAYTAVHNRVTPGNGAGSAFYNTVNSGSMPRGAAKLSSANLTKIKTWIDQGALNN